MFLKGESMAAVQIVVINGRPGVYTWTCGYVFRREESLMEIARKSEDHLLQVCLWLEKHGMQEQALELLEMVLH